MKVYTAALIDKPQRIQNLSLREKIASDLKKALHKYHPREQSKNIYIPQSKYRGEGSA